MGHSFPAHRVDEPRPTSGPPRSPKGPSLPRPTGLPFPPRPPELPAGWKGSLRTHLSLMFESVQVGNWHNFHPVPGVRIDHSKLITFYDPRYSSLVKARHGQHRFEHRLWNISKDDLELAQNDLRQVLTRDEKGSGVNWGDVTRNVVERYSERLDFLKKIVKSEFTPGNVTEAVVLGRQQVLMMLSPYLLQNAAVPPPTDEDLGGFGRNASWIQPSLEHCSTVFTSHMADAMLTDQERLIKNAVEDTAREICRVLGIVWVSAYDAEDKSVEEQAILLKEWTKEVDELMDWLGWSIWVTCSPACGADEMCSLPQWPFDMKTGEERDRQKDHQPHCLSRFHWMPFKHL
ncbi:hypothetical protein FRC03_011371 [Tulasnella sp. 419]|nr:hypothetical protein FRC03_011371 [Tulasnella sp. 419]